MSAALLPPAIRSRVSVDRSLAVAAMAPAAATFAGCYPLVEDGLSYRLVLAATSALFAAIVVTRSVTVETRARAVRRALGLATLFGATSTLAPGLMLTAAEGRLEWFATVFLLGPILGAPTGFAYGLLLAFLVGFAHTDARAAKSDDAADRVARVAGLWSIVPAGIGFVVACTVPARFAGAWWVTGTAASITAAFAIRGAVSALLAHRRLGRRRAWLAAVREGRDPAFCVRPLDARDDEGALVKLGAGTTVLEWRAKAVGALGALGERHDADAAYRVNAVGVPVAIVPDR